MSDAIGKSVCLLLWGGVSYIVLASILILAVDFAQEHMHVKGKRSQPLSKAKVCSAAAVCIVAAIAVLVVVYGFVYILTKGV